VTHLFSQVVISFFTEDDEGTKAFCKELLPLFLIEVVVTILQNFINNSAKRRNVWKIEVWVIDA